MFTPLDAQDVRYVLTEKGRRDLADALAAEADLFDLCRHAYELDIRQTGAGRLTQLRCVTCGDQRKLSRGDHRSAAAK